MFVLLARDPDAALFVQIWIELQCRRPLPPAGDEQERLYDKINEARACATSMREWASVKTAESGLPF